MSSMGEWGIIEVIVVACSVFISYEKNLHEERLSVYTEIQTTIKKELKTKSHGNIQF